MIVFFLLLLILIQNNSSYFQQNRSDRKIESYKSTVHFPHATLMQFILFKYYDAIS